MNMRSIQNRMKHLIEDTNHAFANCGGVNTDYADFATMALSDFRSLLGTPRLTDRELKQLIRKANNSHRARNQGGCWATFMAQHIARQANSNEAST